LAAPSTSPTPWSSWRLGSKAPISKRTGNPLGPTITRWRARGSAGHQHPAPIGGS
jgi:hypothetical protein